MSQEHNRKASRENACREEGDQGVLVGATNGGSGIRLVRGRRAKQAWMKWGMKGFCTRASQHRLKIFKLTCKGMTAIERFGHLN